MHFLYNLTLSNYVRIFWVFFGKFYSNLKDMQNFNSDFSFSLHRQLHTAIIQEYPEVALALIRLAPHPRFLDTPNDDAQSPLHLAVATGQAKIARTLIVAGARPSPRNLLGDSPLHIAVRTGDVSCCKAITDPVHQQERDALRLSYLPPHVYQPVNLDQWNYDGER